MIEPRWLSKNGLLILHEDSLREHGGSRGMRNEGLLESALARPRNILLYSASVSLAQLAAAYAFGIAKNHPFVDGNKRASFAALNIFLEKNGFCLVAIEVDATLTMLKLAAGAIDEKDLAAWIESNIEHIPGRRIPG